MESEIISKIQRILGKRLKVSEDEVRSMMLLIRKLIEAMIETEKIKYSVLNLFCNWSAHNRITESITGLRILARINDTLVLTKDSKDLDAIIKLISDAFGIEALRQELISFADATGIGHEFHDPNIWSAFSTNLLEIIRDVPLEFPPISKLKKTALKIYLGIAQNPIKPGAGVVSIVLSKVDYDAIGAKGIGEITCILIKTEETTTIVVPFKM